MGNSFRLGVDVEIKALGVKWMSVWAIPGIGRAQSNRTLTVKQAKQV